MEVENYYLSLLPRPSLKRMKPYCDLHLLFLPTGYATCGNLTPLTQFVSEFQCSSNLDTLIPQLCQRCALSVDEIQELNSVFYHKRSNQILLLLVILTRKGKGGVVSLIESLESDKEHPGHWDLAQLLRSQYGMFSGYSF